MSLATQLAEGFRAIHTQEGVEYAKSFKPKDSDVIVTTFYKCGTNWMCHLAHMLRSNGNMEFDDVNLIYPWDIMAKGCEQELDAAQKYSPRLYKSHESLNNAPQGAKYIHCMRDPKDAIMSMYNMQLGVYRVSPEEYPFDVFEKYYVDPAETTKGFGDITESFANSIQYYKENPDNVLWVYFEDMKQDPQGQVKRVADFMGISDPAVVNQAYEMSTLEFMTKHKKQFGSRTLMGNMMKSMSPQLASHMKERVSHEYSVINKGVSGAGNSLPASSKAILGAEWNRLITEKFGYKNYEDLRANLK